MEQLETKVTQAPSETQLTSPGSWAPPISAVDAIAAQSRPNEWEYANEEHRAAMRFLWLTVCCVIGSMLAAIVSGTTSIGIRELPSAIQYSGEALLPVGFFALAGYFFFVCQTHFRRETKAKEHWFGISHDDDKH